MVRLAYRIVAAKSLKFFNAIKHNLVVDEESTEALHALMRSCNLEKLVPILIENDIDTLAALRLLTEEDFKELGVSIGLRRKLNDALSTHVPGGGGGGASGARGAPSGGKDDACDL